MNARKHGFSIIEMIIVVAVIGILAIITVFAFSNYRSRAARTEVRNELTQGASAAKNYRNFNNTYPVTANAFNAIHKSGSELTLTYTPIGAGAGYCLTATSTNLTQSWYVSDAVVQPTTTKPAGCP